MKYVLLFLMTLVLLSCQTGPENDLPDPRPVNTDHIKAVDFNSGSITFTLVNMVPEPCYRFSSVDIDRSDDEVSLTIYAQRTTMDPCLQVVSSIEPEIKVTVESGITYLFRFWRYNEATLDTVIAIP